MDDCQQTAHRISVRFRFDFQVAFGSNDANYETDEVFPNIGDADIWVVDKFQKCMDENHSGYDVGYWRMTYLFLVCLLFLLNQDLPNIDSAAEVCAFALTGVR